jgi:hypothetical protein
MKRHITEYRLLALACLCLVPGMAMSQQLPDDDVINVRDLPQPDYTPLGMRAGAFILNPILNLSEEYDDNVFRDETDEKTDFITSVQPGVNIRSDWNLHEVQFRALGNLGYYADNTDENYQDYSVSASGRYDITYETFLNALVRFDELHEDRGSPDDVNGDEPTTYERWTAGLGFARALGKLKLFLDGRYQDYTFDNTTALGAVVDNSNRDRSQSRFESRLAYELSPNYDVFISAAWDNRDYDRTVTVDRNSDGRELRAGTALNITGKVKGEIYGGRISQNYSSDFEDIDTANYGGSLLWNITGLTSLSATLDRSVIETVSSGNSGYVRTASRINIDHALRRNIMLGAFLGLNSDDYIATTPGAFEREDKAHLMGLNIEYKPFRGASLGARYDYSDRESNLAGSDFTNNRFLVNLRYTF